MSPEKEAEVKSWFRKASQDLRAAKLDLSAVPPLLEDVVFHCQQAAEKAIKGYLTYHDRPFQKTHDLDRLSMLCESIDSSLKACLIPARSLTPFAWTFRYPGDSDEPSRSEAEDALKTAADVVETLRAKIKLEIS